MKTKTTLYLSIIISAYFIGKIFNPIPFTNYAFYLLVVALFIPYFGKYGCLKIVLVLSTISLVQDIPFFLSFSQQWPTIVNSIIIGLNSIPKQESIATPTYIFLPGIYPYFLEMLMWNPVASTNGIITSIEVMKNSVTILIMMIGASYFTVVNALLVLSKIYKKFGVYNRLNF